MENNIHTFEFTGSSTEYFKIWIVNVALSVITLGFYSPWAKARTNSYLYGNTTLNGDSFEYTANPVRILIGRLIVVSIFIVHFILGDILGLRTYAAIILLCFFALLPWFVRQAIRFRMRYTRFRGINFRHHASVWKYYKYFIIHPLLNIVTIGLAFPYSMKKFKNLILDNTSYGDKSFKFNATASSFYMAFLKYIGALLLILLAVMILVIFLGILNANFSLLHAIGDISIKNLPQNPEETNENMSLIAFFILPIIFATSMIFGSLLKGIFNALIGNIVYNNLELNKFQFKSDWGTWKLGWIYFSNSLLIIISLGLLFPHTKIRNLRYKLAHTQIQGIGFDEFVNKNIEETQALGEETADFFDFDIGV